MNGAKKSGVVIQAYKLCFVKKQTCYMMGRGRIFVSTHTHTHTLISIQSASHTRINSRNPEHATRDFTVALKTNRGLQVLVVFWLEGLLMKKTARDVSNTPD